MALSSFDVSVLVKSTKTKFLMKRILYCEGNLDGTTGGSYYSLLYLVLGLDRTRYQPLVIFYHDNVVAELLRQAGIEVRILDHPATVKWGVGAPALVRPWLRLAGRLVNTFNRTAPLVIKYAALLKRERIDLLHLNNSITQSLIWMSSAWLRRIPVVCHERALTPRFNIRERYFARRLNRIICISKAVQENLFRQGLGQRNSEIIHNGLDPESVRVLRSPEIVRQLFGIKPGRPVIGLVGHIQEWKGHDVVVSATAKLKERFPEIVCLLVGDNSRFDREFHERLHNQIAELGLQSNVIFTGYQENPADLMNIMDVVIHASIEPEPFGRVILEAMSLSKPVIASRAGGILEIVSEGETGLMVSPGNAGELAEAATALLQDSERAGAMGEKGYQKLISEFPIDRNVAYTMAVYDAILTQHKPPTSGHQANAALGSRAAFSNSGH